MMYFVRNFLLIIILQEKISNNVLLKKITSDARKYLYSLNINL